MCTDQESAMRALTYHGGLDVRVETVPDPVLKEPDDIILRVTATAICGSDLHIYRGKVPGMRSGDILGHEFMGLVVDAGPGVSNIKKGDRVVVPFSISCGKCFFCERKLFAACETTNPNRGNDADRKSVRPGAALFGYPYSLGGIAGGQAEYVRVPKANVGPIKIPGPLPDDRVLFLSDILPTGYQAVLDAGVAQGSSLAIFGAGPVGLMSAACARMLGAERVFMVDHHNFRLEFAREAYGIEPINFDEIDPTEAIVSSTASRGVDAVIDAVGFEAKGSALETVMANLKLEGGSGKTLRQCIGAVRRGGTISVPGMYGGFIHGFLFGDAFEKGLTFKMGQTHAQRYMPELLVCILEGKIRPDIIITHRMPLEKAATGYRIFDDKEDNCRKVVLIP